VYSLLFAHMMCSPHMDGTGSLHSFQNRSLSCQAHLSTMCSLTVLAHHYCSPCAQLCYGTAFVFFGVRVSSVHSRLCSLRKAFAEEQVSFLLDMFSAAPRSMCSDLNAVRCFRSLPILDQEA
jgi:hypothetical protein